MNGDTNTMQPLAGTRPKYYRRPPGETPPERGHNRPSDQVRVEDVLKPFAARAIVMGEVIREVMFRDGCVTEQALAGEGFTIAEIIEHGEDAKAYARAKLTALGTGADKMPSIIDKALAACVGLMPVTAGTTPTDAMRVAWANYCRACAAFRLDPWISQQERCLVRLKLYLGFLPLLEREINAVVSAVAGALKRTANRARDDEGAGL